MTFTLELLLLFVELPKPRFVVFLTRPIPFAGFDIILVSVLVAEIERVTAPLFVPEPLKMVY